MTRLTLPLDYSLAQGWLKPWAEGVLGGEVWAMKCTACQRCSFVPQRSCTCGNREGEWTQLPGTATIIRRTDGGDGSFGLVRFDGADTMTVVRLLDVDLHQTRGKLQLPPGQVPDMILATAQ